MGSSTQGNFWTRVENIASKYRDKSIVVLGKGSSADDVDLSALEQVFVIGVNDAERIGDVDISIFHDDWVLPQLVKGEPAHKLYLATQEPLGLMSEVFVGPFEPLTHENSEMMYQRLFSDSLVIEEVLFMTALRIALRQRLAIKSGDVYFVGFDFSIEGGFSKRIDPKASGQSFARQKGLIEMQERVFLHSQELLRSQGVALKHVGYRQFSDMTPAAFSERMSSGADLFSPKRADSKIQITAELTTNHLGDLSRAKSMMRLAQSQGATLVKFQMRDVETFYKKDVLEGAYPSPFGGTFREYRLGLELSDEDFVEIDEYASKIGLGWFASVLDEISLERAITLKLPMIKIPSTISRKRDFILNVANRYDGELVFSTGMTSPEYVQWLLDILGTERKLYLLHTNSAYPTPQEDCNVSVVSSYAKLTEKYANVIPGYSSHDDGWLGSALAIASGARMIEKHVKLGSQSWVHFDSVALDLETNEFQIYVDSLRRAEKILGEPQKKITPSEHHKY
jgi:N-acetylneuraminate synthase